MSPNKRIFLNIAAQYGRSLFALACGLFTSRWVLASLGTVDYGLFGVVGGLTAFIGFLNGMLATSVSRFYANAIGKGDLAEQREWFNTALFLHLVVPISLMAVGYPLASWAVRNWLTIPPARVETCLWVLRFSCIGAFAMMVSVPWRAMYAAKQLIAELTVYDVVRTGANVVFVYYMATHAGDWLARYALWCAAVSVIPEVLVAARAAFRFPECRIDARAFVCPRRLKPFFSYSCWQFFGLLGQLFRNQGLVVLVNKMLGVRTNAAMSLANNVNAQTASLAGALFAAFSPAIATAHGAGDLEGMRRLAFRASTFGVALILVFAVPLMLELPTVLVLWLRHPPPQTATLCGFVFAALLVDKATFGQMLALNAAGRVAAYLTAVGLCNVLTLPLAYLFVRGGGGVFGIGAALIFAGVVASLGRVWFARRLVGMSARQWVFRTVLPLAAVAAATAAAGFSARLVLPAGLVRVVLTTLLCEVVFLPLVWCVILDASDRARLRKAVFG